jgi:hypothetical protein
VMATIIPFGLVTFMPTTAEAVVVPLIVMVWLPDTEVGDTETVGAAAITTGERSRNAASSPAPMTGSGFMAVFLLGDGYCG